jgi:hypothetical protein
VFGPVLGISDYGAFCAAILDLPVPPTTGAFIPAGLEQRAGAR